ncbi:MAG: CTP synthase [Phototrophicales bacterium]|nr:CTP synthase [Phototrophicales bacterium]
MKRTKYIFCTGGVVSSVGKGVTAAAIGRLLKARGFKVAIQKLDPYLNVDPGTMSPYQHGEVFVTIDGAETDLDLGHYERFTDENLTRACNVTAGQIYSSVIENERKGAFLGRTIQVIPHITDEIKDRIMLVSAESNADVVIVEVGGTVGDIEGQPFLEAIRQVRMSLKKRDTLYIHVTFLPHIGATGELKTKPTQHSVRELRGAGIQPNVIIARTDYPVSQDIIKKLALFCDVDENAVIPLETVDLLYDVPLILEEAGLGNYLVEELKLEEVHPPDLTAWRAMSKRMHSAKEIVKIGIVGKYTELHDAYMSVREATFHAASAHDRKLEVAWIDSDKGLDTNNLKGLDGIIVPGGFGYRGVEGKIATAKFARENQVPYLGLCLGMQVMSIEFARHVLGLEDATSSEFEVPSKNNIIDLMLDQRGKLGRGGTMRLGVYPCMLKAGTVAASAYDDVPVVNERHRHRFEFNNTYRPLFEEHGAVFSGLSPDELLVEIMELKNHPFMVGVQFHPEFQSRPNQPHPLFYAFIEAIIAQKSAQANHLIHQSE